MSRTKKQVSWPFLTLLVLAVTSFLLVRARSQVTSPLSVPSDQQNEPPGSTTPADVVAGEPSKTGSVQPDQIGTKERGPVQMVRFTLFEDGIYPREMRVRQGLVNLTIEDKTSGSSSLIVERDVVNQRIGQVRRSEDHKRGRETLRLTPGRYIVSDDSRPGNRATLLVEP
jgi:hypothetical protein